MPWWIYQEVKLLNGVWCECMYVNWLDKNPQIVLSPTSNMREAIKALTDTTSRIVLVVDENRKLLGVVDDLEIRKAMLDNQSMDLEIKNIMNPNPVVAKHWMKKHDLRKLFHTHYHMWIPMVDDGNHLKGLYLLHDFIPELSNKKNWVVIMAGGLGMRLQPLTRNCPKPMIKIGDKPLLDTILQQFIESGFSRFIFTVNYLSDQVTEYFGDGGNWGVEIKYLRESEPLGTAGSLSNIEQEIEDPLIVSNGDILTKLDYTSLLDFHEQEGTMLTLCVREFKYEIPYGVLDLEGRRLISFTEKPLHSCYVNAGIYVLNPNVLKLIPQNKHYDMTDLLKKMIDDNKKSIGCFPIQEFWLDIGHISSYEKAMVEYWKHFK